MRLFRLGFRARLVHISWLPFALVTSPSYVYSLTAAHIKLRTMTRVHTGIATLRVFGCMHSGKFSPLPPFPPLSFSHVVHEEGVVGPRGNDAHFEPVLRVPVQELVVHVHLARERGDRVCLGVFWGSSHGFRGFF